MVGRIQKPAVFVDRDGVINSTILREGHAFSPRSLEELKILDGVKEAVNLLSSRFKVIVVTNQPDVATGNIDKVLLSQIHDEIHQQTGIEHFYVCIHDDRSHCDCRKPKTGLLLRAAEDLDVDLNGSFLIGDRWKDIRAGQAVGCKCFFIDYSYEEERPAPPYMVVDSFLQAAHQIIGDESEF